MKYKKGEKKMLDICLLGTGGMMPMPNRFFNSYVSKIKMVDCF